MAAPKRPGGNANKGRPVRVPNHIKPGRAATEAPALAPTDAPRATGILKRVGGSQSDDWNDRIIHDTVQALWVGNSDTKARDGQIKAALSGLIGIGPKDELEGMMAAQLLASHSAGMECYRRAMLGEQTFDGRHENLNQANKLSRTFTVLLDALNRYRGKGQQKVTVEHVHVHPGGQAVVGMVECPGGGDRTKSKEQPHAKQLTDAPERAMRSTDAERASVSSARDAEWPLPTARRTLSGSAEGK
jgi:hypothetical protein